MTNAQRIIESEQDLEAMRGKVRHLRSLVTDDATYELYDKAAQELRAAEFHARNGAPRATMQEREAALAPLKKLQGDWRKGEVIKAQHPTFGATYKPVGSGALFRSVTVDNWKDIQAKGVMTTDGRSCISPGCEGLNFGSDPETAAGYIPLGGQGVVLAIKPDGLNLFMSKTDDYIRTTDSVPVSSVIAVSGVLGRDKEVGQFYFPKSQGVIESASEISVERGPFESGKGEWVTVSHPQGEADAERYDNGRMNIGEISVDQAVQGQGIGRALVLKLEEIARAAGDKLITGDAWTESIPFWQKLGYKIGGKSKVIDGARTISKRL